jgi:hypothetical protein
MRNAPSCVTRWTLPHRQRGCTQSVAVSRPDGAEVAGAADTARVSTVDLIPAPAADAVVFRQHRLRVFATMTVVIASVWLLLRGVFMVVMAVVSGHPPDAIDVEVTAVGTVLVPLPAGLVAALSAGRRGGWVRASAAGLEFAATRQVQAFLPWPAVESISLRFRGPFTQLLVTPTHPDAATLASARGRAPRLRRRFGAPAGAYIVDVGMMTPWPLVLLAELNRRLATRG